MQPTRPLNKTILKSFLAQYPKQTEKIIDSLNTNVPKFTPVAPSGGATTILQGNLSKAFIQCIVQPVEYYHKAHTSAKIALRLQTMKTLVLAKKRTEDITLAL